MTLGIALSCNNGVVIGSDEKVVQNKGVEIEDTVQKTRTFQLQDSHILCCYAGSKTVAERVVARINPESVDDPPGTFPEYMREVVENRVPAFCREYQSKHRDTPNATIALAGITRDGPMISTVYSNGQFDYDEEYTAIGSGSLIAEVFLRDSFFNDLNVEVGRKAVAYILERVSDVDSRVDGIDVISISEDTEGPVDVSTGFVTGLKIARIAEHDFKMNLEDDLEVIHNHIPDISPGSSDEET